MRPSPLLVVVLFVGCSSSEVGAPEFDGGPGSPFSPDGGVASLPDAAAEASVEASGGDGGGGGRPKPGPGATIVLDTRAGGAQSYQTLTTHEEMVSVFGASRFSNGASGFFIANVDGLGTKARGCQWVAPDGTEQECYVASEDQRFVAPATGWYTQWKVLLGRSASSGGTGALAAFSLTGANPHQKMAIWTRENGTERLYLSMTPTQINIRCDGLNYNSPTWSQNPYGKGGPQTITVFLQPSTGTIRAWLGDTLVADAAGESFGTTGLVDFQETVTTFPGAAQVQAVWDEVIWY